LATESLSLPRISHIKFPSLVAVLFVNDLPITGHFSNVLKQVYHSCDLRQHLQHSNCWRTVDLDDIWWDIHGKALNKFPSGNRTTLQKFLHSRWPCNQREDRYYQYRSPYCVLCPEVIESQDRILCCPCPKREQLCIKYISDLRVTLRHFRTNEDLINVFSHYLFCWLNGQLPDPLPVLVNHPSIYLHQAVLSQNHIGWGQVFKGRMSIKWAYLLHYDILQPNLTIINPAIDKWGQAILKLSL
jgi:hypothetical protein